ncbi:retrovirus-related Pol polyprotein from transposon 412 [Trichonephila clavipes]|nr:retrovirus-related Pol polyprotein from transposon 412 [Trichonephila clavipes]
MPITRATNEQLKALLEGINALKSRQEETKERLEHMQRSQEETRKGQQEMQKGLEGMQKSQEETKNKLKDRIDKDLEDMQKGQKRIQKSNGWTEGVKAFQLAASLKREAAEKYSKGYAPRRQVKTRLQKTGESLQEYASEVERLANLAFSDHPATAVKLEAAPQACRKERHYIRSARGAACEPCESRLIKEMEKLNEEMQTIKAGIRNQEKRKFRCWGCGGTGHLRRNCPRARKEENPISSLPNRKTNVWGRGCQIMKGQSQYYPDYGSKWRRQRTLLRIANISDRTRTIQEGEVITACAPVTCVDRKCNILNHSSDYLVKASEDFRRTRLTQHRIDTGQHTPIKKNPRRLPFAKQEKVQTLIKDMTDNNVLDPSSSLWTCPIVLVKKKDGSTRFCVDYRRLNDVTKKDSYPLPRIDDTFDTLAGNTWFFSLDL